MGQGNVRQVQYNSKLQRKWTPKICKYIHAVHGSTTETQHTLTTMRNHWTKAIVGLEHLALNNGTAEPQH